MSGFHSEETDNVANVHLIVSHFRIFVPIKGSWIGWLLCQHQFHLSGILHDSGVLQLPDAFIQRICFIRMFLYHVRTRGISNQKQTEAGKWTHRFKCIERNVSYIQFSDSIYSNYVVLLFPLVTIWTKKHLISKPFTILTNTEPNSFQPWERHWKRGTWRFNIGWQLLFIGDFLSEVNIFSILINWSSSKFNFLAIRTVAVMVVSSVWHGVYSGYYLSLGSVPFVLMVEDLYEKIMRRNLDQKV